MSKDVIHTHGEDLVVREDTAKAFRGIHWAIWSIGAFVVITVILLIVFFTAAVQDGSVESPSQIQNPGTR